MAPKAFHCKMLFDPLKKIDSPAILIKNGDFQGCGSEVVCQENKFNICFTVVILNPTKFLWITIVRFWVQKNTGLVTSYPI